MAEPFVKHGHGDDDDFYAVEAAGLRWLAEAGPETARVATVLDVGPQHIALERLIPVPPTDHAAAAFGRGLAATHAAGADAFGSPPAGWTGDGYIGNQRLSLRPAPAWGAFFAEQRLLPYAQAAAAIAHLSRTGLHLVERVAEHLIAGAFDDQRPPARIHGDLWAGNLLYTAAGAVLIDPAAHGGHGLTDLAMLHLFGAPGLGTLTEAYADAAALRPDFRELLGLHQLHPLLVHAVSHGPAYGVEAERVARRYV